MERCLACEADRSETVERPAFPGLAATCGGLHGVATPIGLASEAALHGGDPLAAHI